MALATWTIAETRPGTICLWHGLLANIPAGYYLCDGSNGTPDLRAKFVKGAAAGVNPGATGGSSSYTPGGTVAAIAATATAAVKIGTAGATGAANAHTHPAPAFTGTPATIEPPYYAVAYIMKS